MEALTISNRRELFVDRVLIDRLENAALMLHEPVSGGTAICNDKPWEGAANFGMSVIQHDGLYRMYYRGWADLVGDQNGVGCVAVSKDGEHWQKPVLNLFKHPEWRETNIIIAETGLAELSFPFAPWVDSRPGVAGNERIKGLTCEPVSGAKHTAMNDPGGAKRMVLWVSPDGCRFYRDPARSQLVTDIRNAFDGGNTLFWSEAEQQYVLYIRWYDDEWGRGRRSMLRVTSKDLVEWTEPVPMTYGNTEREEFYVNNTQPYFRAPHIYIAPAARFVHPRPVVTKEQAEAIGLMAPGPPEKADQFTQRTACSDGVLLTSRAGSTQYDRTFMETFVRPGIGYENWTARSNYPLTGIFPCGPDRMMLFVTRHYMQATWHIERLLLRTDGFASVSASHAGGEMVTKPLLFTGRELEINYRTGAPGFVKVEIQDAGGNAIPGFTLGEATEIIGDEIGRVVSWKQGADVSRLAGQPVRLRFVMKDADLFALKFG